MVPGIVCGRKLMCECAYRTTGRGCRCKHIAAVEHTLLISSEAALGKKIVVEEKGLVCPDCKEERYTCDGLYHGKHEKRQRYRCPTCGWRFRNGLGFEYRHMLRLYITLALMLSGTGMPVGSIQVTLRYLRVDMR